MSMQDLRGLCAELKALQSIKDEQEEALSKTNKQIEAITRGKIPELMASLELRTATFEGLGRVQLAEDLFASTREGKKEAAMQWLRDCGYADMISETYNASSVKALFRRQIKEGAMPPDEIFNITPFTRASLVKA
jgi:hypothetical protein